MKRTEMPRQYDYLIITNAEPIAITSQRSLVRAIQRTRQRHPAAIITVERTEARPHYRRPHAGILSRPIYHTRAANSTDTIYRFDPHQTDRPEDVAIRRRQA